MADPLGARDRSDAILAGEEGTQRHAPRGRTGPSVCHVVHHQGSGEVHFSRETVEQLLASEQFFWLDLDNPDKEDFEILSDVFGFHPLAVEDSEHFGQRAKIDDYDDFVFLVVYGAVLDDDRLVEVHCFYSERFLVTVHRDDCPAFTELRSRYQKRDAADRAAVAAALPDHRRPRRQLLPDPGRPRRPHRRARGQHLPQGRRLPVAGDLPDEAAAGRHAQGCHAAERHVRASDGRHRRAAGTGSRGRALLPRRLRPPDPDLAI